MLDGFVSVERHGPQGTKDEPQNTLSGQGGGAGGPQAKTKEKTSSVPRQQDDPTNSRPRRTLTRIL